jgi:hypothetical protein
MMATVPQVVILNDVLDAHKSLLIRLDVFHQLSEIAVGLAATALDLIIVVAVPGYEVDEDLVCDEIFPVCASYRAAIVQHQLGAVEVLSPLFEEVLDLPDVSHCLHTITVYPHIPNGA